MDGFRKIAYETLPDNPFRLVGTDWMLLTAGKPDDCNTMTASWGGMGVLWNKPVVFCFIRPSRHTWRFFEREHFFSLSFFPEGFREALSYCGTFSGRDVDKFAETGLTPLPCGETTAFKEARLVFRCRKIYSQDLDPTRFLDPNIAEFFPGDSDYHRLYIGELEELLQKAE
jgi:flavin reductase (DIM6/NTAB) family NADH-FMN oxidoreductase RutF